MLNKYGIGGFLFAALLGACASTGTNGGENGTGEDGCASRCTSFGWEECLGEGEFAAPVSCADDEICIADSGCGVCVPGARYCGGEDEQDMFLCSDDGAGGEKVGRCEGDEVCSNGFCKDRCAKAEDEPSNVGCHFWAVDLDNEAAGDDGALSNDAAAAQYAVVIANNNPFPAEAKVFRNGNRVGEAVKEELVKTVTVAPYSTSQIDLPQREVDGTMGQNGIYERGTGSGTFVSPHAYRIETNEPVVAYQFNPIIQQFSNDASILIPRQALGEDYFVLGYPTANPCKVDMGDGIDLPDDFPIDLGIDDTLDSVPDYTSMTIVGTEDNTVVTVVPTHPTRASDGDSGLEIQAANPGEPITFTINQYDVVNISSFQPEGSADECIMMASEMTGDMTGSSIQSNKPVAVFSSLERGVGTGGTEIEKSPNWTSDHGTCCTDHLEQQMFPTTALGWQFAVSRSPQRSTDPNWVEPDVYRVLATVDGTQIETNLGGDLANFTLNRGEWRAFSAKRGFSLSSKGGAVMLGQYLISQGLIPDGGIGDPTFVVFPAAEQHRKDYTFLVPTTFSKNYMVLSKPVDASISIDGNTLGEFNDCVVGEVGVINGITYDQITCEMNEGVHNVSSNQPFGLTVYGYYNVGSYGYPGGSDVKLINPIN